MATTEQTRVAWDSIAAGYDEHVTTSNMGLARRALESVGVKPGMRVLDVAAGSGAIAIPAARIGAEVVAIDISPAMVERLEGRASAEQLDNLDARVMDAHELDLPDANFDLAGSQFGVMLVPDLPRALREMARVTVPGGRVLIVAFGDPARLEFIGFFIETMRRAIPGFSGLPTDPPPLPFQVSNPDVLRQRMVDAGLSDVQIKTDDYQIEVESGRQLWDAVIHSNPIGAAMVADLTDEQRRVAQNNLDLLIDERSEAGIAILHNPVNIGVGTK